MRDIHSRLLASIAIGAAVLSADNTPPAIDLNGFNAAEIVLAVGVGGIAFNGTNRIDFVLTHSDDNVSYTAVTDDHLLGVSGTANGIIKALRAAHAAEAVYRFGYIGGKRYLKLLADFNGTHGTGTPIAAIALLGLPSREPVANQA